MLKRLNLCVVPAFMAVSSAALAVDTNGTNQSTNSAVRTDQNIVGSGKLEHGGYGAPVAKIGPTLGKVGSYVGATGGWIINHDFAIGMAGYGLSNKLKLRDDADDRNAGLGYGGFRVEYLPNVTPFVRANFSMLVGAGGIAPIDNDNDKSLDNAGEERKVSKNGASFTMVEPEVGADINMLSFMRLYAGVSYRFATGLDYANASNKDLSGATAIFGVKFGAF
jgi:hypothetical protein